MPPKDPNPIVLFGGGDAGFGDARAAGRPGYAWTFGMDNRGPGQAVPSTVPSGIGIGATDIPREVGAVIDWENTKGEPFFLIAGSAIVSGAIQRSVARVQGGVFNVEDSQAGVPYTGGVLYRHDGSDQDAEAAFFCNGEDEDEIERRKKDSTYTADGIDDAKADGLFVVGSDLWRTKGYIASELTRETSPGTDANFPVEVRAGRPTYPINVVLEMGGSPVPLKGDGVFKYNPAPSAKTFGNQTSFVAPHKENGKGGIVDGRGRIYCPTVDGDVLVLSPGLIGQQRPTRMTSFDRDTPFGRGGALVADANHVYMAIDPGSVRTQQLGLTVKTYNAADGTYNDHTSAVTGA